jgi:hypothetical protein
MTDNLDFLLASGLAIELLTGVPTGATNWLAIQETE